MDFIDKANQEWYSSNFIKPSLKKYIDIHFYAIIVLFFFMFFYEFLWIFMNLWICYVYNTIHRFKNKIANLSTINREKKMSLGAWTRVDRVEVHYSNHKATGAFAQKPKIKKNKKKHKFYILHSVRVKRQQQQKNPKPAHSFFKFL